MSLYQVCPEVQVVENESSQPGQEFFVSKGSRYFYVSTAIAELIEILQRGANISTVLTEMAVKHQLGEKQVRSLLDDKLPKLGIIIDASNQEQKPASIEQYIRFSLPVLSEKFIALASHKLQYLYNPAAVILCLVLLVAAFTTLLLDANVTLLSLESLTLFPLIFSIEDYVWLYFVLIFSYITHELGHAAASHRYGIPVKKIGLGLYFIFPVFFADISKAWSLSVGKRTIINVGGTYFQLLYLAGVALYASITDSQIAIYAIYIILNSIIISLSPFLRFDGYWIYSDIFKLPNLRGQSRQLISSVLFSHQSSLMTRLIAAKQQNTALFYYSVASLFFLVFIGNLLLMVGISMVESAPSLYHEIRAQLTQSNSFYSYGATIFRSSYYVILTTAYALLFHRLAKAIMMFFSRYEEAK